ncbi:hypothetical protein BpHYR1_017672, partial [Brachionus plicatilis]
YLSSDNGLGVVNKICAQLNSECEQAGEQHAKDDSHQHQSQQISFILEEKILTPDSKLRPFTIFVFILRHGFDGISIEKTQILTLCESVTFRQIN